MASTELGTRLRDRLAAMKAKYSSQQGLAMAWYEEHGDTKLSNSTVESRLSELLNGKLDGLKFFFGQRDRAVALLRLLEVKESDAAEVLASAEQALAGHLEARTILDLRGLQEGGIQQACAWIETEILPLDGLLPVTLLVLPAQVKQIPRGFDEYRDLGRLTWVEEVGQGVERATALLAPTPWALGSDRQAWPWHKWVQFGVVKGQVQLDPPDALEQLASRGGLAAMAPVQYDLAGLGGEGDEQGADKWLEARGVHWRGAAERLLACADPKATAAVAPDVRLALAARLGLVAGATAAEVEEHEIALVAKEIGAGPIEKWSEAELKAQLEKARTRPLAPVVARVNGQLHAMNWPTCAGRESGGRLVVHEVVAPVPAIDAVRARLGELSSVEFQFADDLEALVVELVAQGHDRLAVRHACATLYLRGELSATGGAYSGEALPPEAADEHDRALALGVLRSRYTPAQLHVPVQALEAEESADSLDVPMPGGQVTEWGKQGLARREFIPNDGPHLSNGPYGVANPWFGLRRRPLAGPEWLDAFEDWAKQPDERNGPLTCKEKKWYEVQVDWAELDGFCNLLKVNLDRALKAGHWHHVDRRTYLVPLGSGVCAQVILAEGVWSRAALEIRALCRVMRLANGGDAVRPNWRPLPLISGDANCGPRVLNQVTFAAGKVHLTVTFHADPFTASAAQAWPAVAAKLAADEEEERRRRDED